MPASPLAPRLREAIETVTVNVSRLTAHIGGGTDDVTGEATGVVTSEATRDVTSEVTSDTVPGLRHALANKLYEVLHAGLDIPSGPRPRTLRDEPYEKLLAEAVPHRETLLTVPAASLREPGEGEQHPTVVLDGVRTYVPRHLLSPGTAADRLTVRYPCARPALSAGFFLVDGAAGRPEAERTVRLYVHIQDPLAAPHVWRRLLSRLEAAGVPYRAKVSSSPLLYPRRDAAVCYLDGGPAGEAVAADVAAALAGLPGLGAATSVFARRIAPGLALADEPDDPRTSMTHMSFGQHRAHAVAQGLVDQALGPGATDKWTAVSRAMAAARIRPDAPWQNAPRRTGPGERETAGTATRGDHP